jgi:hypothetical protein
MVGASRRKTLRVRNAFKERLGDFAGSGGTVPLDAFDNALKLIGGAGCPPDARHDWKSRSMQLTTSSWSTRSLPTASELHAVQLARGRLRQVGAELHQLGDHVFRHPLGAV